MYGELFTGQRDRETEEALQRHLEAFQSLIATKTKLKRTLGTLGDCCHTGHSRWSTLAAHHHTMYQVTWRHTIKQGVSSFEDIREVNRAEKRRRRNHRDAVAPALDATFICSRCRRACRSRIGLAKHECACSRGGKEKERREKRRGQRRGESPSPLWGRIEKDSVVSALLASPSLFTSTV